MQKKRFPNPHRTRSSYLIKMQNSFLFLILRGRILKEEYKGKMATSGVFIIKCNIQLLRRPLLLHHKISIMVS